MEKHLLGFSNQKRSLKSNDESIESFGSNDLTISNEEMEDFKSEMVNMLVTNRDSKTNFKSLNSGRTVGVTNLNRADSKACNIQ